METEEGTILCILPGLNECIELVQHHPPKGCYGSRAYESLGKGNNLQAR